ncbi:MAG: hypothetical protein KH366_02045 [Clostridiaceae bacterium]|nr:hypothetical protein [Clostridiaceae bacterium]
MKKKLSLLLATSMVLALTACGSGSKAPAGTEKAAETKASAAGAGTQTEAPKDLPEWPFTDKEITFYTRNSAGGSVTLSQQYLLDIVFEDGGTSLLVSDATSGGAVCVEKTYAAGGDGYTFYMSGNEMVIGEITGTFDYSLKNDFQVLGMLPSNGAPNFIGVSKTTLPDVKTMEDLVDYCKANPGKVRFAYAPDTVGEVYATLFADHFGLDVKMTISEGSDSKPNLMGGIVDVVFWNQRDTIEYSDYLVPVVALSNERSVKEELADIPCYAEKDLSDCVVPSVMFLACKNDIDASLAQAINAKWNEAIKDAISDSPSEKGKLLKEYMDTQNQILEPLTIEECWEIIDDEYEKIGEVLGNKE